MRFEKLPIKLKGYILIYCDQGTPSLRVFDTQDALAIWVGRWHLKVGRSDSHWVDAVVNGEMTVVDESLRIYHGEDTGDSSESEEQDEPAEPAEGDKILEGVPLVDLSGESPAGDLGVSERDQKVRQAPDDQL